VRGGNFNEIGSGSPLGMDDFRYGVHLIELFRCQQETIPLELKRFGRKDFSGKFPENIFQKSCINILPIQKLLVSLQSNQKIIQL